MSDSDEPGTDLEILTPLDRLNPRQRLAIEFYSNPLYGRTFGNKTKAALAAGYEGNKAGAVFHTKSGKEALAWVMEQKDADAAHVADFLSRFSMDAARKLVEGVGLGDGLEIHAMPEGLLDKAPEPIISVSPDGQEKLLGFNDAHLKQAKAITDHNKSVAAVAREVRESVKLLLAYQLGTPEQKVKVEHNKSANADPLDLGTLSDEELRELARHIQDVRSFKRGGAPPPEGDEAPVVEAEMVED